MCRRRNFDDIQLGDELGSGGFSAVFEAKVKGLDNKYVVKCIKEVTSNSSNKAKRVFQKELEVLCQVSN